MHAKLFTTAALVALVGLTGCGGSGSSSNQPTNPSAVTGQFIDSAVAGLAYDCSSGTQGITDLFGTFTCPQGDTIHFNLNGFYIGSSPVSETITPHTLYPDHPETVTNLAQLLQTLDSDNNPANGITINSSDMAVQALSGADVALEQADFDSAIVTYIGTRLVDETAANAHLNASIQNIENGASGLTSLSTVVVMNGLDAEFCANLQDAQEQTFVEGFADYAEFIAQGGSQSITYYPSAQNCDAYSEAGYCEMQDFSNVLGGTGSCVQAITFPFVPGEEEALNDTIAPSGDANGIGLSEYASVYKPMMPNLRNDNVYFNGTATESGNSIVAHYQTMAAEEKIADGLYFIGGNPAYGYELYTDSYFASKLSTRYYIPRDRYEELIGTWDTEIVDNVHTKKGESRSTKFSKKITPDTLRQMYLEVGMDIDFDDNDMAQFMVTSDSVSYGYVTLAVNQNAYLKIMTAFETYVAPTTK